MKKKFLKLKSFFKILKKLYNFNKRYGQVWVVFDKDDYSDEQFNSAIKNCEYVEEPNKDEQASQKNPMTQVYKGVEGLKEYLE